MQIKAEGEGGAEGGGVNRTNSTSPPPHYTAHTRSPLWLWQKNNNNTIVFVGLANGRSWRTSLSPSHQPCPSVNAFERLFVLHYILLPTNLHLFPQDKCFVEVLVLPTLVPPTHRPTPPPSPLTMRVCRASQIVSFLTTFVTVLPKYRSTTVEITTMFFTVTMFSWFSANYGWIFFKFLYVFFVRKGGKKTLLTLSGGWRSLGRAFDWQMEGCWFDSRFYSL